MSARLSTQQIIGNIGMPPEFKHKDGQTPFAVCTVGVTRTQRRGSQEKREPLWYRVTLWGHHAETAVRNSYKGQQVYVSGRFDVDDWTDRDGKARYTLEISAEEFQMLGESITSQAARADEAIAADRGARAGGAAGAVKGGGNLASGY